MNVLRKALATEAAQLKPLLDLTYHSILKYQTQRTPATEAKLREAMEPTVAQLMIFRPYMPTYKQDFFNLLESDWRTLTPGDLIMLFDHCVNIMHLRMERAMARNEAEQPWSRELLEKFDERRALPPVGPAGGEFLTSGLAAAPGQVTGLARVILTEEQMAELKPGEILVCRMSTPDWLPYLHQIRAMVTDQGGALSHAAIVARELGLPCVTGCQNATSVIRTGDRIEVNGDLGIVTAV